MTDAFFVPTQDGFHATEHARGPWDPDALHGGPPAALMGRAIEQVSRIEDAIVARFTVEILRPVPLGHLRVSSRIARPGRSVELSEAELSDDRGPVALARAWRIRTDQLGDEADLPDDPPPPPPETGAVAPFFALPWAVGYHTAVEAISVGGAAAFHELGPATMWLRARYPLLPDEPLSPLGRVLIAADSGNGVSASLPLDHWMFINPDLTVSLHRYPVGEWVCLDARTISGSHGVGLATTRIADLDGHIGRGAQSLLIAPR